ncbi:MAG: XrtA/PEP-CTERM system histidine kinase PrsK [Sphingomonadaceae bacterium]
MRLLGIKPSRTASIALVALAAAAVYFLAVLGAAALITAQGGLLAFLALFALPLLSALAAAVLLPARRTRGWVKVMLAKHVFTHRYDYRAEWLRFNDTLGSPDDAAMPLGTRVVKAIADITDSPAGLVMVAEDAGLVPRAAWNWDMAAIPAYVSCDELLGLLSDGRIIELETLRDPARDTSAEARAVPVWIMNNPDAWAIVPLIHFDRLAGAVVIASPAIARTLDWEDFDLLRVAGRQAASYLAEARGQEALSDVARFDEFNRRFAFIMHDIKNLASQLTLVARNAERHADKPEFRRDMIATLNASTSRMTDLLAKLSQHGRQRSEERRTVLLTPLISAVATDKRGQHPVVVAANTDLAVVADPARLSAALAHIVQNAIDASPPHEPVTITLVTRGDETGIEVSDKGCGMTPDFVRGQLFRPFASTKDNGFGIGAYEARALITAMGGRIAVESDVGQGSRFTIWLPALRIWHEALVA